MDAVALVFQGAVIGFINVVHGDAPVFVQTRIDAGEEEAAVLKAVVNREARASERWEKIKVHVFGVGIVAVFGWIGKIFIDAIIALVNRGQP